LEDAPNHEAISEHVIVVIVPFARWATKHGVLQEQVVFVHLLNLGLFANVETR
jgi:hypothetical protein